MINKLKTHYEQYPPRLSYGGNEGKNVTEKSYQKWPTEEESKPLGVAAVKVWYEKLSAKADTFPVEGYCVVDACLDDPKHFFSILRKPSAVDLLNDLLRRSKC